MNSKPKIFLVQPASTVCNKQAVQIKAKVENKDFWKNCKDKIFCQGKWELPSKRPLNSDVESETRSINSLYGPLCLLILTSAAFGPTLIPVHNVITNPDYWFEIVFSTSSTYFFFAITRTLGAETVLNPYNENILPVILKLFLTSKLTETAGHCFVHFFWSKCFGYFEPFPHRCLVVFLLFLPVFPTFRTYS